MMESSRDVRAENVRHVARAQLLALAEPGENPEPASIR